MCQLRAVWVLFWQKVCCGCAIREVCCDGLCEIEGVRIKVEIGSRRKLKWEGVVDGYSEDGALLPVFGVQWAAWVGDCICGIENIFHAVDYCYIGKGLLPDREVFSVRW